jgi:signal peptidase I
MDNEANKPRQESEELRDSKSGEQLDPHRTDAGNTEARVAAHESERDAHALSTNDSQEMEEASSNGTSVHKKPANKNEAWEWAKALLIALGLVFVIRWFIFAPFIVDGQSMEPNFDNGERIIVNKILYSVREPKRGEVIVFHAPTGKDFIKRVIALPGESVRVQGDNVYINGELLDEPYLQEALDKAHQAGRNYNTTSYPETKVPDGSIFAMGDNRSNSTDSRMIGAVALEKVVGRADIIFWPASKIHLIH